MKEGKLKHEELVFPSKNWDFLNPRYVPINSQIYNSTFAYKENFLEKVVLSLEKEIEEDLSVVEKFLNEKIYFCKKNIEDFFYFSKAEIQTVSFQYFGSQIFIQQIINENPSWNSFRAEENGLSVLFYLRNFAISFNNLGIDYL